MEISLSATLKEWIQIFDLTAKFLVDFPIAFPLILPSIIPLIWH